MKTVYCNFNTSRKRLANSISPIFLIYKNRFNSFDSTLLKRIWNPAFSNFRDDTKCFHEINYGISKHWMFIRKRINGLRSNINPSNVSTTFAEIYNAIHLLNNKKICWSRYYTIVFFKSSLSDDHSIFNASI